MPTTQVLPYRWGRFQGIVSFAVGIFVVLFAIFIVATGEKLEGQMLSLTVLSPLFIVSGYAFFRRRKFAVAITYVWMGLVVLLFLVTLLGSLADSHYTSAQRVADIAAYSFKTAVGLLFWVACNKYYRRRRLEFT